MQEDLNFENMKRIVLFVIMFLFINSCKEKKTEFVHSEPSGNIILLKYLPKNNVLTENIIKDFLLKHYKEYDEKITYFSFYRYTNDTKYFLENRGDHTGGLSQNALYNYPEAEIAAFMISKCKKDTTKLVGELYFYNMKHKNPYKPDTLIYHCK